MIFKTNQWHSRNLRKKPSRAKRSAAFGAGKHLACCTRKCGRLNRLLRLCLRRLKPALSAQPTFCKQKRQTLPSAALRATACQARCRRFEPTKKKMKSERPNGHSLFFEFPQQFRTFIYFSYFPKLFYTLSHNP